MNEFSFDSFSLNEGAYEKKDLNVKVTKEDRVEIVVHDLRGTLCTSGITLPVPKEDDQLSSNDFAVHVGSMIGVSAWKRQVGGC
jgi:hypothetical protein